MTRPALAMRALAAACNIGWRSDRGLARHLVYFAEACHLFRLLNHSGATHLHAHFGTNPATVALLTQRLGGPPFSFTVHGPEEFDKPVALALCNKVHHAKLAIAISSFGRSQLCRWCHVADWPKLHVVHCGVDAQFLAESPLPVPDVPRVVCIGRLGEQKGQLVLLEAAARVRDQAPALRVVLAGDGPMRGQIDRRIAELKLHHIVTITGWLSNAQVREQLRQSRGLVLPSFAEGLPVVIMEALALGRPVVSTYIAGIPELVRDGESGFLVPAGSVDDLAAALLRLLHTPADRLSTMGQCGRAAVLEHHDAAREAAKLAALFQMA